MLFISIIAFVISGTSGLRHYENCVEENGDEIENHPSVNLLSQDDCGVFNGERINGGEVAKPNEFPWLVLLSNRVNGRLNFYCGGTLINARYVLTAAHCIKGFKIDFVRVGEYNISSEQDCYGMGTVRTCAPKVQDIDVSHKIIHPNYLGKSKGMVNDIGLMRLKKSVDLTARNAGVICLPVSRDLREGDLSNEQGTIAGWGRTEEKISKMSEVLLKVVVPISSTEMCRNLHFGNRLADQLQNTLCADEKGKGSCKGDSGGPLMLDYPNIGRYVQHGIVSYGMGCGTDKPSFYTDVRKYMKWILDTIKP